MSDVRTCVLQPTPHASCLVGGPACGKTAELIERAKACAAGEASDGVLYICATRVAASRLREQLSGFGVEVKTGLELALEVLGDQALAARGVRGRLLGRAERRVLMEDVKVCGIKRRRLRELVAFLECGFSNLDDSDPAWIKTNEEELVAGLIRGNLEFTGGVLPCEASALAYREVVADAQLCARHARAAVFVDDYEFLGRATQALANALAAGSVCVAAGDVPPVPLDEPYPYAPGVQEFLEANPSAQVERLDACRRPSEIVDMLNRLRADEALSASPLKAALGGAGNGVKQCREPEDGCEISSDNREKAECAAPMSNSSGPARCAHTASRVVDTAFAPGIVAEFADIAERVKAAVEQGVSPSRIFIAGTNAAWRGNLARYLEQTGVPACAAKQKFGPKGKPSLRVLLGEGDPLCRSVQVARLRAIAQPQGMQLDQALEALAAGKLAGASADDPLLEGLVDAYWIARGKAAALEGGRGAESLGGDELLANARSEYERVSRAKGECSGGTRAQEDCGKVGGPSGQVIVGAPLDACGRTFDLVVFGGFVNGFIPSADYCDPAALVGAARTRAHEADVQAVYRCISAARGQVAFTGFTECGLEAAEQLKLHIARIKLKRGVRMCAIEPSELLNVLGVEA